MEEKQRDLIGLVPEVYFDLIARVVPGFIAILICVDPTDVADISGTNWAGIALVGFIVAYAVGFVLDMVGAHLNDLGTWGWKLIISSARPLAQAISSKKKDDKNPQKKTGSSAERLEEEIAVTTTDQCIRIDEITDRAFAAVLTKVLAEKALMRSLFVLAVLLSFCPWWTSRIGSDLVMPSISVGLAYLAWRLGSHFQCRLDCYKDRVAQNS